MVEVCSQAAFCFASVLCKKEFLTVTRALERRSFSYVSSGLREIHNVISRLMETSSVPRSALANRRIFFDGKCEVWSLSPSDEAFQDFLKSIRSWVTLGSRQRETRIPDLSPNKVAIALWLTVDDVTVLLGSDLEKNGWIQVLQSRERPAGKASVFKVPHHGSRSAYVPEVWEQMLDCNPIAMLTPWRRGGRAVPSQHEVDLILSHTSRAYASAPSSSSRRNPTTRSSSVYRTIRESGVKIRQLAISPGVVRIRYPFGSRTQPSVETFGAACELKNLTQR